MDYADLIEQIVAQGKAWHQHKRKIAALGYANEHYGTEPYETWVREARALDRQGRKMFKKIVQMWLAENGFESTNVQTQACYHLPGKDFNTPFPHKPLPLGFSFHRVSIHNAKGVLQAKYKWLNKITVAGGYVKTQKAQTDPMFEYPMAEKFAEWCNDLEHEIWLAFRGG